LTDALEAVGAVRWRHGNHQEVWRVTLPDKTTRTFPISDYHDLDESYIPRVFLDQIGLTKPQLLAAVNGENPCAAAPPAPARAGAPTLPQAGPPVT